jgi:hypothetical protein
VHPRYRLAAIAVVVALLVGSCGLYAMSDRRPYPSKQAIADDPSAYDGTELLLFGEVTSVDRTASTVTFVSGQLTVEGRDVDEDVLEDLEAGASIQIYGTLREQSSVIVAERTVVDYRGPGDQRYVRLVSIAGALCGIGAFLWYWRLDWRRLCFRPRRND